jgi:hypothetical protein
MTRQTLGFVGWWLACLATVAHAESPAEVKLQGLGLVRTVGTFVHKSEAPALEKIDELNGAYSRLTTARKRLAEADLNNQAIVDLTQQAAYLKQEQNAIASQYRGMRMPRGASTMVRQNQAAQQQQEQALINQVNNELNARKKLVPSPQARKDLEADASKRRDEMAQAAAEARKLVDEANAVYESLAKDAAVKAALAEVQRTTTDAIKLGPSKEFHTAVKAVANAERLLKLKPAAASDSPAHKAKAKAKR